MFLNKVHDVQFPPEPLLMNFPVQVFLRVKPKTEEETELTQKEGMDQVLHNLFQVLLKK